MSALVGGVAAGRLKSFIERIERLEDEIKGLNNDKKDVYAEAKATGFDVKVMKRMLHLRRMEKEDRREQLELEELYLVALGMA